MSIKKRVDSLTAGQRFALEHVAGFPRARNGSKIHAFTSVSIVRRGWVRRAPPERWVFSGYAWREELTLAGLGALAMDANTRVNCPEHGC